MADIILVGLGPMGQAYAKVLQGMAVPFVGVGNSQAGVDKFAAAFPGVPVKSGGVAAYFGAGGKATKAIVAVPVPALAACVRACADGGVANVLVEKPGALTPTELAGVHEHCKAKGSAVAVALNRRFFASVRQCLRELEADGGATQLTFEFTEWTDRVLVAQAGNDTVLSEWMFANSPHVIDTAFVLGGGRPAKLSAFKADDPKCDWHKHGARWTGAGVCEGSGALFAYHADWAAPGRWWIEVCSRKRRFVLRPMEKLQVQMLNSVKVEPITPDDAEAEELDAKYKPGLYAQTAAWLANPDDARLASLSEAAHSATTYFAEMMNGSK